MRARLLLALALIAVATLATGVSASSPSQAGPTTSADCPDPGTSIPVLLVHGLLSGPSDFTQHADGRETLVARIQAIPGTYVDTGFSYQAESSRWVTNPAIGQALANRIACLAQKSKAAGGVGKVVVVAHSMGGLAVREAAALHPGGSSQPASSEIGLIVTIATPNTGSWDDGLFHTVRNAVVGPGLPSTLAWILQGVCGLTAPLSGYERPGMCGVVQGTTSEGGSAMVPGSKQLADLPAPPWGVPLDEAAGQMTVTARLFRLGPYVIAPPGSLGDLLVKPDSALAYESAPAAYEDSCTMRVSDVLFTDPGWLGCTHGGLLYVPAVGTQVVQWIDQWMHPTISDVTASLASLTQGQASSIVLVPGGFEAATYDQAGHVAFWRFAQLNWTMEGQSTYPVLSGEAPQVIFAGALLTGMSDATFLASGSFSGDGTGNNVAFTNGPHGWGTVAPGPSSTLVPSGNRSTDNTTPGNEYFERFLGGNLQVSSPGSLPYGPNGEEWQVVRTYHWNGAAFAQTSSNVFTAAPASPPPGSAPNLQSCPSAPPDGTYTDFYASASTSFSRVEQFSQPSSVTIQVQGDGPSPACAFTVDPNFPVTIGATTTTGHTWITAPAWALTTGSGGTNDIGNDLPGSQFPGQYNFGALYFQDSQNSPFYIPPSLGITQIDPFGAPVITVKGGKLMSMALLNSP